MAVNEAGQIVFDGCCARNQAEGAPGYTHSHHPRSSEKLVSERFLRVWRHLVCTLL